MVWCKLASDVCVRSAFPSVIKYSMSKAMKCKEIYCLMLLQPISRNLPTHAHRRSRLVAFLFSADDHQAIILSPQHPSRAVLLHIGYFCLITFDLNM